MLSALKRLFGRISAPEPAPPLVVLPPPEPRASGAQLPSDSPDAFLPEPVEFVPGADPLTVPFAAILQQIPVDYWGKLAPAGVAGCNFSIAKADVLEQLSRGAVKVPLGELKRWVPPGVFSDSPRHDSQLVDLPLRYLLRQLHPDDYAPKTVRQRVEVPADIADVFNTKGGSSSQVRVLPKAAASPTPTVSAVARARAGRLSAAAAPAPTSSAATLADAPAFNSAPLIPIKEPSIAAAWMPEPAAGLKPASPAAQSAAQGPMNLQVFQIALEEVAIGWPEPIRTEIAQLKVPVAKCALLSAQVCEGLKRGQIQYTWGYLRSRIYPNPPQAASPLAETRLDLPLDIVTPLFLEFIRSGAASRKSVDPERITDFFRKAEVAAAAPAPTLATLRPLPPTAAPAPAPAPVPVRAPKAMIPAATPSVSETPAPAVAAPVFAPAAHLASDVKVTAANGGSLSLPLSLVSSAWPEPVQQEIVQAGLSQARVEIPFPAIEPALRQGKIEFQWLQICSWLSPAAPLDYESPYSEARLTLPLPVVAPIFLQQKLKKLKARTKVVPEGIPDLFTADGTPVASDATLSPAPASAVPPPSAACAAVPVSPRAASLAAESAAARPAPAPGVSPPRPANLAELFGEPNKRKWTPNDIANKTVQLSGVAGALIALQDGLLVAHCMPPGMKADTIAAFLPQIIGRMNQYAKEFHMGDLNSVTLTIAQGTLQIYHPGTIYFAVLGRPGDALPIEKLDFIAAELSRRGK